MSDEPQLVEVFVDFLPNQPRNDESRELLRQIRRKSFEENLDEAVERVWDLPSIVVKPRGEYLTLLQEARELYIAGHFYPCVAMCGIVGERLAKDVLRISLLVQHGESPERPSDKAFDQLERVEVSGIVRFLREAGLLSEEAARSARKLGELRNDYAHARGKSPQEDALKAIGFLHTLVEGTVSAFEDHEIKNGVLVPKTGQQAT